MIQHFGIEVNIQDLKLEHLSLNFPTPLISLIIGAAHLAQFFYLKVEEEI